MPGRIKLPGKRTKYNAAPTVVDGTKFASKKEARRYSQLVLLEKAGEIRGLEVHPFFHLHAPPTLLEVARGIRLGKAIGKYVADFAYYVVADFAYRDVRLKDVIVEDVKGGDATKTELYKWKKRHMELEYGIAIQEV